MMPNKKCATSKLALRACIGSIAARLFGRQRRNFKIQRFDQQLVLAIKPEINRDQFLFLVANGIEMKLERFARLDIDRERLWTKVANLTSARARADHSHAGCRSIHGVNGDLDNSFVRRSGNP